MVFIHKIIIISPLFPQKLIMFKWKLKYFLYKYNKFAILREGQSQVAGINSKASLNKKQYNLTGKKIQLTDLTLHIKVCCI